MQLKLIRHLVLLTLLLNSGCVGDASPRPDADSVFADAGQVRDGAAADVHANDIERSDLQDRQDTAIQDTAPQDLEQLTDRGSEDLSQGPSCDGTTPVLALLSPAELHNALQAKDFLLINVGNQSPQIPGTDAWFSYTDNDGIQTYIGDDLARQVVLYCVSGGRSAVAAQALADAGYCHISQLEGGINAWIGAGFATE